MSVDLIWTTNLDYSNPNNLILFENTGENQEILDFGNNPLNGWVSNGQSTYRITNGNSNDFIFNTSNGKLVYQPNPDYEQDNYYNFTVEVTSPLIRGLKSNRERQTFTDSENFSLYISNGY